MATSDLTNPVFREALVFAKSVEQHARNEVNKWIETENAGIEQQRMELLEKERNLITKTEAFEKAKECFNRFLMEKQTEFDRKTVEFQEEQAQKEIELNRKACDVQEMLNGLRAKEEQINAKDQELAVKEELLAKERKKIASEGDQLSKEKKGISLEKESLAKDKRMIALEKEDLVKEKKKIVSDQEGLAIERKEIADTTREERRLLDETQAKLKKRIAELKERRSYLDAREQNLAVVKFTELDLKCKLAKLEEEKEKFEKWKAEEESTLRKQQEKLTLQRNMTAKPNPMEELASRGWMRIEDFFDNLYRLKLTSNLSVSESTLSGLSKLLERLQSKRKIVDGMIKIDQNATCITLGKSAEDGSPTPLISESSPDGFDSTLRTMYNALLSKVTKPTQGCNSVAQKFNQ